MFKYFRTCKTAEEGKRLYKELLKKFHPDCPTGNEETMKEINTEFETWWETHKNIHRSTETGETYTASGEKQTSETAKEYMQMLYFLYGLKGIQVELTGSWLWITGNTYQVKDQLIEKGFQWSKSKRAWFYAYGIGSKTENRYRGHNMSYIRNRYGSENLNTEEQERAKELA